MVSFVGLVRRREDTSGFYPSVHPKRCTLYQPILKSVELLHSTVRWTPTQVLTVPDRWRATRQKSVATEGRTRETRVETVAMAVQSGREIRRERLVRKQICAISEDVSVDDAGGMASPSPNFTEP